jgi:hypothetical protein
VSGKVSERSNILFIGATRELAPIAKRAKMEIFAICSVPVDNIK